MQLERVVRPRGTAFMRLASAADDASGVRHLVVVCGGGGVVSGVMAAFTLERAVFITSLPMVQLGQLQVALAVAVAFCTLPRSMATDCCTSPCNIVVMMMVHTHAVM